MNMSDITETATFFALQMEVEAADYCEAENYENEESNEDDADYMDDGDFVNEYDVVHNTPQDQVDSDEQNQQEVLRAKLHEQWVRGSWAEKVRSDALNFLVSRRKCVNL